jgi:hypothetical protein
MGLWKKVRLCSLRIVLEEHVELCCTCVLLMKAKVAPELEAGQRSKRKAYRRARKRALARLREGTDLRWTPPRSREQLHER